MTSRVLSSIVQESLALKNTNHKMFSVYNITTYHSANDERCGTVKSVEYAAMKSNN